MTDKNRSRTLLCTALLGGLLLGGCGDLPDDYIDAQGTYGDGRPISFHERAQRISCDSTMTDMPCVTLVALKLSADVTEVLRGVRISYTRSKITSQMPYQSGLTEPITLYAVRATADKFVDSSIAGGQISFSSIAAQAGDVTAGTFSDMSLTRPDQNGNEQMLFILKTGTFKYNQP